jgi:hypothetical protein
VAGLVIYKLKKWLHTLGNWSNIKNNKIYSITVHSLQIISDLQNEYFKHGRRQTRNHWHASIESHLRQNHHIETGKSQEIHQIKHDFSKDGGIEYYAFLTCLRRSWPSSRMPAAALRTAPSSRTTSAALWWVQS